MAGLPRQIAEMGWNVHGRVRCEKTRLFARLTAEWLKVGFH